MSQADFKETISRYGDLTESVEIFSYDAEEGISQLRARLRLFDGAILWIREVRTEGVLEAYSYYWLRPDDTVIMGWDNAPHHSEISTFPHHRHVGDSIEASAERTLGDVLDFIREFMG